MRKIGLLMIVVVALILPGCESTEPSIGTDVALVFRAEGAESWGIQSAGRISTGPGMHADSVIFTEAMIGVTEVELEALDTTDMGHHEGDGCKDDDDNSGPGDGDEEGDDDNSGPGDGDEGGRTLTGWPGDDDDDDDSTVLRASGEFIVDLIAGTSTPDLGFSAVPAGLYQELEFELGPILPDNNSVFIAFEIVKDSADSANVKVEFSSKSEIDFEIEEKNGFEVGPDALAQILVMLNLDTLLGWIQYGFAKVDEDGVIRINETSNRGLYYLIKARLHHSIRIGEHHGDDDD